MYTYLFIYLHYITGDTQGTWYLENEDRIQNNYIKLGIVTNVRLKEICYTHHSVDWLVSAAVGSESRDVVGSQ